MNATNICEVLSVATVEGGIIVRDLKVQKNPVRPRQLINIRKVI